MPGAAPIATPKAPEAGSEVMDELRALRKIVEHHLAGYAWGEFSRQNPAWSDLLRQLLDAGLPEANIESSLLCTACRTDLLFSHRAEKGVTGRMMAAIGMRR